MQNDPIEKFKNLPQDLKDAIFDVNSANIIQAIAKKYGLNIEQTGKLAEEVGLLMLGSVHPRDFIRNLSKKLEIDIETAKKIASEINEEIFSKVKESLKKIHAVGEGIAMETPAPAPTPVPTPVPTAERGPNPPPVVSIQKAPEVKEPQNIKKSPFEQKLEIEKAREENRYPDKADPYKEPPK